MLFCIGRECFDSHVEINIEGQNFSTLLDGF